MHILFLEVLTTAVQLTFVFLIELQAFGVLLKNEAHTEFLMQNFQFSTNQVVYQ